MALRDGSTVRVRPVRAEDEDAMLTFLEGLDQGSRMFRFFSAGTDLEAAAHLMADVDYSRMYGLIAVRGANDEVVAQGNYFTSRPSEAEIAFTIARDLQGRGLGNSAACPPRGGRTGQRDLRVHSGGDARQPPDDRGL